MEKAENRVHALDTDQVAGYFDACHKIPGPEAMSDYRPICDVWILARPKVPYYGAFPGGFVHRARELLGITMQDCLLHVCAGRVRDYRFRGSGRMTGTLDIDPELQPDFVHDARLPLPGNRRTRRAAIGRRSLPIRPIR